MIPGFPRILLIIRAAQDKNKDKKVSLCSADQDPVRREHLGKTQSKETTGKNKLNLS